MRYRWLYLALLTIVFVAGIAIGNDAWWVSGAAIGVGLILVGYWFTGTRGGAAELTVIGNEVNAEGGLSAVSFPGIECEGLEDLITDSGFSVLNTDEYGAVDLARDTRILSTKLDAQCKTLAFELAFTADTEGVELDHSQSEPQAFVLRFEGVSQLQMATDVRAMSNLEDLKIEVLTFGEQFLPHTQHNFEVAASHVDYRFACERVIVEPLAQTL